jgi:radical S-adenosyl methionine domain-containing protein 2
MDQLVINFHILQRCNFNCYYCYSKWKIQNNNELHTDLNLTGKLLSDVYQYFKSLGWKRLRLSLVGGEPFLLKNLGSIIETAHKIGFDIAIISNGSMISEKFIFRYAKLLQWIGFSIDAIENEQMLKIGRASCSSGKTVDIKQLIQKILFLRSCNPNIGIKINTVVNNHNFDGNIEPFIKTVMPDKWKILQVLPILDPQIAISDDQFRFFIDRHKQFSDIWAIEDNDAMIGSYIMLDPMGRFFDNSHSNGQNGYIYSEPVLKVGSKQAFKQINFDLKKFAKRYKK